MARTAYPATTNVVATYTRGPGTVIRRLLVFGQREDRALMYLMVACIIMAAGSLPGISRRAFLEGVDVGPLMQAAVLGWVLFAPLVLYLIAPVPRLIGKLFGGQGSWYGARLSLFWALLAASPLYLLLGLTDGFVGQGLEWRIVGSAWLIAFAWFWIGGAVAQERAA